ncbi:alkyl sulfatase C-terminal domain-containing protein [Achromobacter sp. UMC46]|uniref:alkyl sulfatase C-terminal domain-containing protein n=1 Tax=Achromobacter sp. UMC46 TaxID=1862319 RepID=UPI0016025365|nr:alkyl sulfatase C-terminal domain-containing protein [Achromobacter sp. UMC46]MBB1592952.1 hypothetical protein [Achromobacter sp. UMC46]
MRQGQSGAQAPDRDTLNDIMLMLTTLKDSLVKGDVMITGDQSKLIDVFGSADDFEFWCNIVTP